MPGQLSRLHTKQRITQQFKTIPKRPTRPDNIIPHLRAFTYNFAKRYMISYNSTSSGNAKYEITYISYFVYVNAESIKISKMWTKTTEEYNSAFGWSFEWASFNVEWRTSGIRSDSMANFALYSLPTLDPMDPLNIEGRAYAEVPKNIKMRNNTVQCWRCLI